jgi:hypothetical protein
MSRNTVLSKEFSAKEVCEICGVSNDSLQNWIKRKLIVGHREIKGGGQGPGRHRRFSFFNVVEVAIANRLMTLGMQPKEAFKNAAHFAHSGGGGEVFDMPERLPGLPFHQEHGDTIFAVGLRGTWEAIWGRTPTSDPYAQMRQHVGDDFISLNVTNVFNELCNAMGLHPFKTLDEIYGE